MSGDDYPAHTTIGRIRAGEQMHFYESDGQWAAMLGGVVQWQAWTPNGERVKGFAEGYNLAICHARIAFRAAPPAALADVAAERARQVDQEGWTPEQKSSGLTARRPQMAKYRKTALVEAEQFLPNKGQIPAGVYSSERADPRKQPLADWMLDTLEGPHVLRDGDYICTGSAGERWNVERSIFEATYEPATLADPGQPAAVEGMIATADRDAASLDLYDPEHAGEYGAWWDGYWDYAEKCWRAAIWCQSCTTWHDTKIEPTLWRARPQAPAALSTVQTEKAR